MLEHLGSIKQTIGYGPRSAVYLIQNKQDGYKYVLKVFYSGKIKSPILDESSTNKNNDFFITPVYEFRQTSNKSYQNKPILIEKYFINGSLGDIFVNSTYEEYHDKFSNTKKMILMYGLARCIKNLHISGKYHGNIKLHNTMLDFKYYPCLSEIGTPDYIFDEKKIGNRRDFIYNYLPPEYIKERKYDARSDIYSLGLLFYSIITGLVPYDEIKKSEICSSILKGDMLELSDDIPEDFRDLISKCISHDITKRPNILQVMNFFEEGHQLEDVQTREFNLYIISIPPLAGAVDYDELAHTLYESGQYFSFYHCLIKSESQFHQASVEYGIGMAFREGKGVLRNLSEAVKYFKLSAEKNYADAQLVLGICYQNGEGIGRDLDKAIKYFKLAAEQNNSFAQYALALCYEEGDGVQKNLVEAARLYHLAADQNHADAQYALGLCYENGEGVQQNVFEARKYLQLAADQNHELAKEALLSIDRPADESVQMAF